MNDYTILYPVGLDLGDCEFTYATMTVQLQPRFDYDLYKKFAPWPFYPWEK